MTPGRIARAVTHRLAVIARYATSAPSAAAAPKWIALGAVRARLTGGEARMAGSGDGKPREFDIQIGAESAHKVRLDLSSLAELDGFEEIFVRRIYRLDGLPFRPHVVLDCGANVGFFASLCRMAFNDARIYCWEPEVGNFERLKVQPLLQSGQVVFSSDAVSDGEGKLPFAGGGLGGRVMEEAEAADRHVESFHLAPWLQQFRDEPTLIKIDIEGHEERLIPSLADAWPRNCALFLETHQERGQDAALLKNLAERGFDCKLQGSHDLPGDRRVFNEYFAVRRAA
jgi:FkbM family methyltransferase